MKTEKLMLNKLNEIDRLDRLSDERFNKELQKVP